MWRRSKRLAVGALLVYLALAFVLMIFEEHLIFFPSRFPEGDWQLPPNTEDVRLLSTDGTSLHAWFLPHDQPRAIVLYLHGNAGNLTHRRSVLLKLRDQLRLSVMILDYRGYGRSDGSPDESGVLQDARAARDWLATRAEVPESRIVLIGRSLGGGIAVDLAEDGARALVLESTFSSLVEMAAFHYPWLPVRRLMRTRLDSASKIPGFQGPLLQSHGDQDEIIPYRLGRKLFDAAGCDLKQWITIAGGTHNDPQPESYYVALDRFLDRLP